MAARAPVRPPVRPAPGARPGYGRGGRIDHIDYGTRLESGVQSLYSAGFAPARVVFGAGYGGGTQNSYTWILFHHDNC